LRRRGGREERGAGAPLKLPIILEASPLFDSSFLSLSVIGRCIPIKRRKNKKGGAKPLRVGGWEKRDKLKTWGDGVNAAEKCHLAPKHYIWYHKPAF
jgi:hypothetical protein